VAEDTRQRVLQAINLFDEFYDPILFNEHVHPAEISALIVLALDISVGNTEEHPSHLDGYRQTLLDHNLPYDERFVEW